MYSVYIYVHIPENLKTSVFRIYTSTQQTNDGQKRISRLVSLGRAKEETHTTVADKEIGSTKAGKSGVGRHL